MSHTMALLNNNQLFDQYEPESLSENIDAFIQAYQETRSLLFAWLIAHAANALSRHPDYEGSDEERCQYCQLAKQWHLLARTSGQVNYKSSHRANHQVNRLVAN